MVGKSVPNESGMGALKLMRLSDAHLFGTIWHG